LLVRNDHNWLAQRPLRLEANLLDSWKHIVEALVEGAGKHPIRHDDIELSDSWREVHAYNDDFYILRESGCLDAEKPFLYLIFGQERALLEDTGVAPQGRPMVPLAPVVLDLMAKWAAKKQHAPVSLVVIHSHSHGDHTAADAQFKALPGVQVIAPAPAEIQKAAGITRLTSRARSISVSASSTSSRFLPRYQHRAYNARPVT
jgi:glyoxylase-like metal-dependent hydrolase (beta-lactamase superfamily II)